MEIINKIIEVFLIKTESEEKDRDDNISTTTEVETGNNKVQLAILLGKHRKNMSLYNLIIIMELLSNSDEEYFEMCQVLLIILQYFYPSVIILVFHGTNNSEAITLQDKIPNSITKYRRLFERYSPKGMGLTLNLGVKIAFNSL